MCGKSAACRLETRLDGLGTYPDEARLGRGDTSWRREGLVGGVAAAVLALAADAVVLADAAAEAHLALAPFAVMLAYLRSPAFLAQVLPAAMLAFFRWHLQMCFLLC